MVRSLNKICWLLIAALVLPRLASAQQRTAYEMLPDTTQAVVWFPSLEKMLEKWDRTQLAKLTADPAVRPFWEDQRQEIDKRLVDAGWRLTLHPQDLYEISNGQLALAWIERTEEKEKRKPYAIALIVDVVEDKKVVDKLLSALEARLVEKKAGIAKSTFDGESITKYTLQPRPGELLTQETYFAVVNQQLLSSDNEQVLHDMISRAKGKSTGKVLLNETVFNEGRKELQISNQGHIEYFVRPIGFAKLLRAIGGKRTKNSTDILGVLSEQGFEALKCVCGEVEFSKDSYDLLHRGFVLTNVPLPKSAAILDFPNKAAATIPSFVGDQISTYLTTYWNSQEAFWKAEGIVDAVAGQDGIFKEVINGIKTDPSGPKIDIQNDVLPYFTNEIFAVSDTVDPITTDSHRNLIALKLKDSKKISGVLRRAMLNEPDTELVKIGETEVWKKVHDPEGDLDTPELSNDFGDFGTPTPAGKDDQKNEEPWLSTFAVTVYGDYFMFASHVSMIEDAIKQGQLNKDSSLKDQDDYTQVQNALDSEFGTDPYSFRQIVRSDRSYRMQYELFRRGELKKSESMLASLLDRLLQNNSEIKKNAQQVDGSKLPEFAKISHYLQPSGVVARSTAKGWEFGGVMLGENGNKGPKLLLGAPQKGVELSSNPDSRISNADAEKNANR